MNKSQIYIVIFLVFIIILIAVYQYVLNIYEVTYSIEPQMLYADGQSVVKVSTIPLNAFGMRAPFRHSFTTFNITEGKELVEIISENNIKGILIIRAGNKTGKIMLYIKSVHAILPSSFEINIYPNLAFIQEKRIKNL